jgi:hypothetical protein
MVEAGRHELYVPVGLSSGFWGVEVNNISFKAKNRKIGFLHLEQLL